ncbi:cell adhesion molecule 3-like [Asterias amurensis]|uniref:cell adhesion molecule 3-like n=1 Tax=Asterias amurensis TaxID=7602 RepID=UPI003AB7E8A5
MSTTTTICLWVLTFTACLLTVVKTNSLPIRETPSQLRFVKQPNNIHVDQNGRVRLRCRFHGLEPHHIVTWTKNNDTISRDRALVTGEHFSVDPLRYSVIGGYRKGYSDLRIQNVMRFDTGNYTCRVYAGPSKNATASSMGAMLLQSRISRVTVYYLPPMSYPECPVEMRYRELQVGEVVPVCHSQKGFPAIRLHLERPQDESRVAIDTTSASDFIFVTLNITESENGMIYWCRATSDAFPYFNNNRCQVGPLTVVHKPRAVIRPLKYAIHEKDDAVFVCEIESSPDPAQVIWTIYPPIESHRIELFDNNRTLQIKNIHSNDDGRLMSCTAVNTQGNDTAHRVLAVRQPHFKPQLPIEPLHHAPPHPSNRTTDRGKTSYCSAVFAYRVLVPMLVGIILLLLIAIMALMVRSRLWIFTKRLDEHSAQTEFTRPLTEYEFQPAMLPIDNKQTKLSIT